MKETMSQREITLYYALAIGALVMGSIGSLLDRSQNNLTEAKLKLLKNPTTAPESCDPYGCTLITRNVCDGNNTVFNFGDDVCEDIPTWVSNYTR